MVDVISLVCCVNDEAILKRDLLASESVQTEHCSLKVIRGALSASSAYHAELSSSEDRITVLLHQDVYLPLGWIHRVMHLCAQLPADWAVAGVCGMDSSSIIHGHVWASGLGRVIGEPFEPITCVSLDEVVLIVRSGFDVNFDPKMPGFHLYGTDICQQALQAGLGVYAIDAPIIHNSRPVAFLDQGYWEAYRYLQRKWKHRLPIPTCVVPVGRTTWPVHRFNFRQLRRGKVRRREKCMVDPVSKASELGFDWYGQNPRNGELL